MPKLFGIRGAISKKSSQVKPDAASSHPTSSTDAPRNRITVLIAAHNEEESIDATLASAFDQLRPPDCVVVAADNCSDRTAALARAKGAFVFATNGNGHKKPGALNEAWLFTHPMTDLYVCIDADTILPPNAILDWEKEFNDSPELAGCSAKFTMLTPAEMRHLAERGDVPSAPRNLPAMTFRQKMWVRLQKAEFAKWTDTALSRKGRWTSVLAGTACMVRASALDQVVALRVEAGDQPLPWTYTSEVEDFELTYRFRELGLQCRVSADVRAYTGAMLTLKTLWAQRLKWQVGTARDLKAIGINRLTFIDWWQQFLGLITALIRISWITLFLIGVFVFHRVSLFHYWWIFPLVFVFCDVREALRVPHRTKADILTAAALIPQEVFAWIRAAWFTWSWVEVLTGRKRDRWALQIAAEGG